MKQEIHDMRPPEAPCCARNEPEHIKPALHVRALRTLRESVFQYGAASEADLSSSQVNAPFSSAAFSITYRHNSGIRAELLHTVKGMYRRTGAAEGMGSLQETTAGVPGRSDAEDIQHAQVDVH